VRNLTSRIIPKFRLYSYLFCYTCFGL